MGRLPSMGTTRLLRSKLVKRRVWRKIFLDRLSEPLHLNVLSLFVLAFGSFRSRVNWDLVIRPHYAYGVLKAADVAREHEISRVCLLEFGVASGAGIMNMAKIARQVSVVTGVQFDIHGFDTGTGMPAGVDYRDHPDLYQQGDFAMDQAALTRILPDNVQLHLGPLSSTVSRFVETIDAGAPVGFIALDVDYYSSTVDALRVLRGQPDRYLPLVVLYADDVNLDQHNSACGALLAIDEFNAAVPLRRVEWNRFLEYSRVFRRPSWLRQVLFVHILDHPSRSSVGSVATKRYIENPYLGSPQSEERFSLSQPPKSL